MTIPLSAPSRQDSEPELETDREIDAHLGVNRFVPDHAVHSNRRHDVPAKVGQFIDLPRISSTGLKGKPDVGAKHEVGGAGASLKTAHQLGAAENFQADDLGGPRHHRIASDRASAPLIPEHRGFEADQPAVLLRQRQGSLHGGAVVIARRLGPGSGAGGAQRQLAAAEEDRGEDPSRADEAGVTMKLLGCSSHSATSKAQRMAQGKEQEDSGYRAEVCAKSVSQGTQSIHTSRMLRVITRRGARRRSNRARSLQRMTS